MTHNEALDAYLADQKIRSKKSSVRIAKVHARTILKYLNHCDAELCCRATVNALVENLRQDGMRDTSINGVLRILRAALRFNGLLPVVKLLRETKTIPDVLSDFDLQVLFLASNTTQCSLALHLAAYAGLRKGEIAHLTWGDVDFAPGGAVVRVAAKGDWTPKSHAERAIPLNERMRTMLWNLRPVLHQLNDLVIWDHRTWATVATCFVVAGLAGRGKPGLHMLRRTFASRLLGGGADIETVRELGGWADLTTVQRYVASTNDLKRAAVERL